MRSDPERGLLVPFAERRDTRVWTVRFADQWKRLWLEERRKSVYPWPHWKRWLHRIWQAEA